MRRSAVVATALVTVLVTVLLPWAGPARAEPHHRVLPCSRGLVALTFDDGPSPTVTPRMVRLLRRLEVPATFFMVGSRVADDPDVARAVDRAGFAIGNHTWEHTDLTTQTTAQVRRALRATRHELVAAGVTPTGLARPPYGAVDDRVRRELAREGYTTVLWTIDSRDWSGLSPREIEKRVVGAVRPHRTNVVLQHDGVTNSPATLKALPDEIATLRRRGYCFAGLGADGEPTPPVPIAAVRPARSRVPEGERVLLTVRLDRPTTRTTPVRVAERIVRIPAGHRVTRLWFRAPQDRTDERPEHVTVYPQTVVTVVDDDPAPVVSLADAAVTASPLLPTTVPVEVRLDRRRDRPTTVVVRSELGPARVVVPALSRHGTGALTVPVGRPRQAVHEVRLHAADATATLTVRPPEQTWREAAREAFSHVSWDVVTVPHLW